MVKLEILSADVTGLLEELIRQSVQLTDVRQEGFKVSFLVKSGNVPIVRSVADKRGDRIKGIHESSIHNFMLGMCRHSVLVVGILGILLLTLWIPTRVLFVQVDGNERIPSALVLEHSEACGVTFGAARAELRNEELKNYLLDQIPELQWVGVNTRGCVARISVKERSQDNLGKSSGTAHIIARRDGVIRSCTVSRGTAQCAVGQAVRAGELLISGYTDCGGVILQTRAEGEIYGETNHQITAAAPDLGMHRGEILDEGTNIVLRIGKKQINLSQGSGILDSTCVKMEREYILTLPGGFELPLAVIVERWYRCNSEPKPFDAQNLLPETAEAYLYRGMIAGQILHSQVTTDGNTLYGNYVCLEQIGQLQYEENTIAYGKSDGTNSQRGAG